MTSTTDRSFIGGAQSDVAAAANALARAGATGAGGDPVDETDLLGLAGGIGFMHAIFAYKDFGPTMTITTRTVSTPDPFVTHGVERAGVAFDVLQTGSPKVARRSMDEALDAGHQLLVSVETAALPYQGSDATWLGAGPRVIGIVGRDGDDYLIDDRAPVPHRISAEALMAARGAVKGVKHRAIVVMGLVDDHDHDAAVRAAMARTVAGYQESPAKSFVKNIGTAGLHTWAARLVASNAKGWPRMFAEPTHLHYGLRRVVECIDHELTAPHAGRPMFAAWLRRASAALADPRIGAVATTFDQTGERFGAAAELAANADGSVAAAVGLVEEIRALLDGGDVDVARVKALRADVESAKQAATLGGADAGEVFEAIAEHATAIADAEEAALAELAGILGR